MGVIFSTQIRLSGRQEERRQTWRPMGQTGGGQLAGAWQRGGDIFREHRGTGGRGPSRWAGLSV